jgi:hypothetical protein
MLFIIPYTRSSMCPLFLIYFIHGGSTIFASATLGGIFAPLAFLPLDNTRHGAFLRVEEGLSGASFCRTSSSVDAHDVPVLQGGDHLSESVLPASRWRPSVIDRHVAR